ncbi:helix-turn-helix domain-containing protein [Elioraea sp.]|uniref:helix-turn-helix domain-containing protein n=1 Tax=Elioraea sp. TaxID=2185103 RepID=UPI0025C16F53|nr:AraC family transcriptional regulator [Elioraea sp.]
MPDTLPRLHAGRGVPLITPARLIAALDGAAPKLKQARPWPPVHRFLVGPTEIATPAMTDHVIVLHLSGDDEIETDIGGRMRGYRLTPGQVGIMPAMQPSTWRLNGQAGFLHLYLPQSTLAGYAQEAGVADRLRPGFGLDDPFLAALLARIGNASLHRVPLDRLLCESIERVTALHLLSTYGESRIDAGTATMPPRRLRAVRAWVEEKLAEEMTLDDLAAAAGMSRFHFARAFRAATGVSPWRYVTERRIARARDLLLGSDMPVGSVAAAVGFATASHFAQAFRALTGEAPTAFRKRR